jgi:hypothetical protein
LKINSSAEHTGGNEIWLTRAQSEKTNALVQTMDDKLQLVPKIPPAANTGSKKGITTATQIADNGAW